MLEETTYKINGLLFDTYKALGPYMKEKIYQEYFESLLKKEETKFAREIYAPFKINGKTLCQQYLDFLIDEKIIVELKVDNYFRKIHFEQVNNYLKTSGKKLGILALFTKNGVRIKRVFNN